MMSQKILDYILSHHEPKDYGRCFSITISRKKYHFCSRCVGWYSSFLIFWFTLFLGINFLPNYEFVVLYLFPIPAIVDWSLHKFEIYDGTNFSRILTGFLIGFTFANLLYIFFRNPFDCHFWAVTICYAMIVMAVLNSTK